MEGHLNRDSIGVEPSVSSDDAVVAVQPLPMDDRRVSSWWLVVAVGAAILVCTGGPSFYVGQRLISPPGNWQSWMYLYPFGAVGLAGIIGVGRRLCGLSIRRWPWPIFAIGAFVAFSLLSALWSVSASITPTAAMIGIGIAAFGCWFGWCLCVDDQIWSVVIATAAASITSALAIRFRPTFGKMYAEFGSVDQPGFKLPWQGIFGNRNSLAPVCVLGIIGLVGLVARRPSLHRVLLSIPLAILHIVLLDHSGGLTSTLALGLVGITAIAVPALRLVKRLGVPGLVVALAVAIASVATWFVVFANLDRLSLRIGRNPTLDGRRPIWADVRSFIRVHPLRGYGYWGFWDRQDLTAETYARLGPYGSAHNSVLEVLLMLGLVGLVIYLIICGAALLGPFVSSWRRPSVAAWWWSLLIVFLVAQNLTESFVLWHSYIWVLFVAAALAPFGDMSLHQSVADPNVSLNSFLHENDSVDQTEPAQRPDVDDVWDSSASSIAELLLAGDVDA